MKPVSAPEILLFFDQARNHDGPYRESLKPIPLLYESGAGRSTGSGLSRNVPPDDRKRIIRIISFPCLKDKAFRRRKGWRISLLTTVRCCNKPKKHGHTQTWINRGWKTMETAFLKLLQKRSPYRAISPEPVETGRSKGRSDHRRLHTQTDSSPIVKGKAPWSNTTRNHSLHEPEPADSFTQSCSLFLSRACPGSHALQRLPHSHRSKPWTGFRTRSL